MGGFEISRTTTRYVSFKRYDTDLLRSRCGSLLPVGNITAHLQDGHLLRQLRQVIFNPIDNLCFGVEMIHIRILAFTPLLGVAQTRAYEMRQRVANGSCSSGDILALLDFVVVANLEDRSACVFRLFVVLGHLHALPVVGDAIYSCSALEGGFEGRLIVQIAFD